MMDIISGIGNLLNNPILVGIGALLALVAGFFLRRWIMPWLQDVKDKKNQDAVNAQSKRSEEENKRANKDADKIFD